MECCSALTLASILNIHQDHRYETAEYKLLEILEKHKKKHKNQLTHDIYVTSYTKAVQKY